MCVINCRAIDYNSITGVFCVSKLVAERGLLLSICMYYRELGTEKSD